MRRGTQTESWKRHEGDRSKEQHKAHRRNKFLPDIILQSNRRVKYVSAGQTLPRFFQNEASMAAKKASSGDHSIDQSTFNHPRRHLRAQKEWTRHKMNPEPAQDPSCLILPTPSTSFENTHDQFMKQFRSGVKQMSTGIRASAFGLPKSTQLTYGSKIALLSCGSKRLLHMDQNDTCSTGWDPSAILSPSCMFIVTHLIYPGKRGLVKPHDPIWLQLLPSSRTDETSDFVTQYLFDVSYFLCHSSHAHVVVDQEQSSQSIENLDMSTIDLWQVKRWAASKRESALIPQDHHHTVHLIKTKIPSQERYGHPQLLKQDIATVIQEQNPITVSLGKWHLLLASSSSSSISNFCNLQLVQKDSILIVDPETQRPILKRKSDVRDATSSLWQLCICEVASISPVTSTTDRHELDQLGFSVEEGSVLHRARAHLQRHVSSKKPSQEQSRSRLVYEKDQTRFEGRIRALEQHKRSHAATYFQDFLHQKDV